MIEDGSVSTYAELSAFARGSVNDMLVTPDGFAYAGEVALVNVLSEQIALAPRGTLRKALEDHLDTAVLQIARRAGHAGRPR